MLSTPHQQANGKNYNNALCHQPHRSSQGRRRYNHPRVSAIDYPRECARGYRCDHIVLGQAWETIVSLGLALLKEVDVETASGIGKARIFQDAKISLLSREGTFECLELPGGSSPLLGVIPLEALGIELDLKNQRLEPLPISPTQTYLTILVRRMKGRSSNPVCSKREARLPAKTPNQKLIEIPRL